VYAGRLGVDAVVAAPIIAAFLLLAPVYLAALSPSARAWVERRWRPPQIGGGLVAVSLAPYLVYSIPLGLFQWEALAALAMMTSTAAFLFVWTPPQREGLSWQDVLLLLLLATPVISGLGGFFQFVYPSPGDPVPRLDVLGKMLVFPLGAFAFLSLRRVEGVDLRFLPRREDWRFALKWFLIGLPAVSLVGLGSGFVVWNPIAWDDPGALGQAAAKAFGIYLATALPEELCFRGVLLNLSEKRWGRPWLAQAAASLLFGTVHLGSRGFPNLPFAATAAVAGWFYGSAWREGRGVVPAALTHTMTVTTWMLLFR